MNPTDRTTSTQGDEKQFMQRIMRQLHGDAGHYTAAQTQAPQAPRVPDDLVRVLEADADLTSLFCENASAMGMHVQRCTLESLEQAVAGLIREVSVQSASVHAVDETLRGKLDQALQATEVQRVDWPVRSVRDELFDVDLGITQAWIAVAETGSLVAAADTDGGRSLSLVPPNHLAIVRAGDIVADVMDLMRILGDRHADLPSGVSMITGPSKTADIEGVLIKGVHGPGRVWIMVVEQEGSCGS